MPDLKTFLVQPEQLLLISSLLSVARAMTIIMIKIKTLFLNIWPPHLRKLSGGTVILHRRLVLLACFQK